MKRNIYLIALLFFTINASSQFKNKVYKLADKFEVVINKDVQIESLTILSDDPLSLQEDIQFNLGKYGVKTLSRFIAQQRLTNITEGSNTSTELEKVSFTTDIGVELNYTFDYIGIHKFSASLIDLNSGEIISSIRWNGIERGRKVVAEAFTYLILKNFTDKLED